MKRSAAVKCSFGRKSIFGEEPSPPPHVAAAAYGLCGSLIEDCVKRDARGLIVLQMITLKIKDLDFNKKT